jgi:sigma-B regulation protein RsbU (phosphoserine phosphatase)
LSVAKSSIERLRFCNFKLRTLLNITQAINRNLPIEELLATFKNILSVELNIGRFVLYSNLKEIWSLWLEFGVKPEDYQNINVENDLLPLSNIEIVIGSGNEKFSSFDFVIPIFKNNDVIAYVLIGDVDNEEIGLSPSLVHLQFIQTLTNIIMVAIQNKYLILQSVVQERMKKELEMAAQIQASLVPTPEIIPVRKEIYIRPFYMSHYEVGGDYYDFGELSYNDIFFCIADVSGKGMSAAMIMSNFQANLKAQIQINFNNFEKIIKNLNDIIIKNTKGLHFVTLFLAKYNISSQKLIYINAGHLPPILYDYSTEKNIFLNEGCTGIGMLDTIPQIKIGKIKLKSKAKLICFTDGLSEYSLGNRLDYGYYLTKVAMQNFNYDIDDTMNHIIKELSLTKENPNIFDDITILGVQFNSDEKSFFKKFIKQNN